MMDRWKLYAWFGGILTIVALANIGGFSGGGEFIPFLIIAIYWGIGAAKIFGSTPNDSPEATETARQSLEREMWEEDLNSEVWFCAKCGRYETSSLRWKEHGLACWTCDCTNIIHTGKKLQEFFDSAEQDENIYNDPAVKDIVYTWISKHLASKQPEFDAGLNEKQNPQYDRRKTRAIGRVLWTDGLERTRQMSNDKYAR